MIHLGYHTQEYLMKKFIMGLQLLIFVLLLSCKPYEIQYSFTNNSSYNITVQGVKWYSNKVILLSPGETKYGNYTYFNNFTYSPKEIILYTEEDLPNSYIISIAFTDNELAD